MYICNGNGNGVESDSGIIGVTGIHGVTGVASITDTSSANGGYNSGYSSGYSSGNEWSTRAISGRLMPRMDLMAAMSGMVISSDRSIVIATEIDEATGEEMSNTS